MIRTSRIYRMTPPGQALVEALAALALFAMAGAVVASAAVTNVRSVRAAEVRARLVALAARELAVLQALAVPGEGTEPFADGALRGSITRQTTIDEDGTLATLAVAVAAQPAGPRVRLTTRVHLPW